jgi:serine protease AprX
MVVSLLASTAQLPQSNPQTNVPASYYEATTQTAISTQYFKLSGTSMPTPVVSGAAALLLQQHPGLNPDQIKARLMHSAYKVFPKTSTATDPVIGQTYVSQYDIFTVGAGYLDIAAALADTAVFNGTAMSPIATHDSQTQATTLTCPLLSICGVQSLVNGLPLVGSLVGPIMGRHIDLGQRVLRGGHADVVG